MSTALERMDQMKTELNRRALQREDDFSSMMSMSRMYLVEQEGELGLILSEAGSTGISQAASFIRGLSLLDMEAAKDAAYDLMSHLRRLGSWCGNMAKEGEDSTVPSWRVSIHHDGTFLGFSLAWLRAKEATEEDDGDVNTLYSYVTEGGSPVCTKYLPYNTEYKRWVYEFAFNGGLLYRGPGSGETFAVHNGARINHNGPTLWSIHT